VAIDIERLDLRAAFDFAIMIEEDAQVRYAQLARILGNDPGGAGDVFRMMVVNEGKHRDELVALRATLFRNDPPRIEISVIDEDVERPDVDDDDLPRTARAALEVALAAERRAHDFYKDALTRTEDPEVRAFFERLMQEEVEHAALLAEKIARLDAPPGGGSRRDEVVVPPAEADPYADRALLQAAIPRFDAATQAVAVAVIVEGKPKEEVAKALGVSRNMVSKKLARFLEIARKLVADGLAASVMTTCVEVAVVRR
jgi:rubrerythrin